MTTRKFASLRAVILGITVLTASLCYAQFSGSIQGAVQDPSGAMVQNASVQLQNNGTQVTREAKTDADGNFRFVSLEPGAYKVTVSAGGYTSSEVNITLLTEQTLNVPVTLKLGAVSESVTVTTEAPVIDTADSRTELTLENQAVAQLPPSGPQPGDSRDAGPRGIGTGNNGFRKRHTRIRPR